MINILIYNINFRLLLITVHGPGSDHRRFTALETAVLTAILRRRDDSLGFESTAQ